MSNNYTTLTKYWRFIEAMEEREQWSEALMSILLELTVDGERSSREAM